MINLNHLKRFCCEDISLIENYDKAVADKNQTWHCHHRKEDEGYSKKQLIEMNLYYKRTAKELIFMTESDHKSLHLKGNQYRLGKRHSKESKQKNRDSHIGKKLSVETKRKLSAAKKGIPHSEEHKRKISATNKGKTKQKYVWLTPENDLIIMPPIAIRHHPDWIILEQVE